nr:NAD(P)H-dependent oxidoreductase [Streptomyces atroolivaceus]
MSLFRLDASILPGTSDSAELADLVESEWTAVHPDAPVVRRHLGTDPLPADAWARANTGNLTPEPDRTPAQRDALTLAGSLTAELEAAEAVVLAVPLASAGRTDAFGDCGRPRHRLRRCPCRLHHLNAPPLDHDGRCDRHRRGYPARRTRTGRSAAAMARRTVQVGHAVDRAEGRRLGPIRATS